MASMKNTAETIAVHVTRSPVVAIIAACVRGLRRTKRVLVSDFRNSRFSGKCRSNAWFARSINRDFNAKSPVLSFGRFALRLSSPPHHSVPSPIGGARGLDRTLGGVAQYFLRHLGGKLRSSPQFGRDFADRWPSVRREASKNRVEGPLRRAFLR